MESNFSGFQHLIFSFSIAAIVMLESWQVYCLVFTGWIIHDLFLGNAIFRAQQNPPSKRGVLDGDGIMTWFKSLARSDEMRALSLLSSDILRVSYNSQRGAQTFWSHTWCRQHSISLSFKFTSFKMLHFQTFYELQ